MPRIVHLGLGNFHRAHQAWYTSRLPDWRITGVVMRNKDLRDQLAARGNRYLLGIWDASGLRVEDMSVHDEVLLATEQAQEVIKRIADADTQVVTLTITEKGYHLGPDTNRLDLDASPIRDDLASGTPKTAIGILAAGLVARQGSGSGPLSVLSCDNLSMNGDKLQQAILDYLAKASPASVAWVQKQVSFPNAMVDRITPKLSDAAIAEISAVAGDAAMSMVGTEGFSEWIIEDDFKGARPAWDKAGAVFTRDVAPFEKRKLRMLNAAHSYLAYAGLLAGHRYVHEAIADPGLRAAVNALWDEAAVTVPSPAADQIDAYRAALLTRFAVPAMQHDLNQIATDGSLKLRERLVPIIEERKALGLTSPQSFATIQAWAQFVHETISAGRTLDDPNATELAQIVALEGDSDALLGFLNSGPSDH